MLCFLLQMGCANSKQFRNRGVRPDSPLPRSHSLPNHVVCLTSTTFGSLKQESFNKISYVDDAETTYLAKNWSSMIEEKISTKIQKTPVETPPNEPETINAWELMEGLEDTSPLRYPAGSTSNIINRSFSFNTFSSPLQCAVPVIDSSIVDSIIEDFDPDAISAFNKSLNQLNSEKSICLQSPKQTEEVRVSFDGKSGTLSMEKSTDMYDEKFGIVSMEKPICLPSPEQTEESRVSFDGRSVTASTEKCLDTLNERSDIISTEKSTVSLEGRSELVKRVPTEKRRVSLDGKFGIVRARITEFEEKINAKKMKKSPPNGENRVVVYFTSLRGVRKTFEDCCTVRMILKSYRVKVDERDVSMHYGFRDELKEILGPRFGVLPRVFANGRYLGGAEEIKHMNDLGELETALNDCLEQQEAKEKGAGVSVECNQCGGARFTLCYECCGSCKIYEEEEGIFHRCPHCNENGLIRCEVCRF